MVRTLQILHVLEPPDGGVPRYVRDLVDGLTRRGHEVFAAVSRGGRAGDMLRDAGATIVRVDFARAMVAPVHDTRAAVELRRALAGRQWDIVHTHGNKAGALARPLARLRGIPVVHSPHGFAYVTQHLRDRRGSAARRVLTRSIERALSRATAMFVFVSDGERETALRDGIARPDRAAVVRPGVAASSSPAGTVLPNLNGDAPLVGYVGRLSTEKDPILFVDALDRLNKSGVPFRAVVVGDGDLEPDVRERLAAAGLGDRVVLAPYAQLGHTVFAGLDVLVLPSRWEVLPIVCLEAMAAGVPIVARDVGSVSEAVRDGETGLLVREHSAGAVASAVERLIVDAPLRRQLGDRGRQRHAELFGLDRMIDETEGVYRRVLQSSD